MVDEVRAKGPSWSFAEPQRLLMWDTQIAGIVTGIDVIMSGHTIDALPNRAGGQETIIVASVEQAIRQAASIWTCRTAV